MASRLSRFTQKIFGSQAGPNQIAKFGSLFASSPAFTTDPGQAMSLSNWLTGWFGAAIGGNSPAIEDMNAPMFVFAYQLAYLMQLGIPEWDAGTSYFIGSITQDGTGQIYVSRTDNNLNNLLTDATNWTRIGGKIMSALGDLIYGGVNGTQTDLSGNTDAVRKFLSQTGDGLGTSAAPQWYAPKMPTVQTFTSSGTYTPSAGVVWFRVRLVGGGGGGGGGGSSAATGTAGGSSTFDGTTVACNGGSCSGQGGVGAYGGSASFAAPAIGIAQFGTAGGATNQNNAGTGGGVGGGVGGSSPFGGNGGGGWASSPGNDAIANSGSGGGGGGGSGNPANGQGGSSGGYADVMIPNTKSSYAVVIGAAGGAGGAGGSGGNGGNGGSGFCIVEEFYQ